MFFPLVLMAAFSIGISNSYLFPAAFFLKFRDLYHLMIKSKRNDRPSSWVVRNIIFITLEYIGIVITTLLVYFASVEKRIISVLVFGGFACIPKLINFFILLAQSNVSTCPPFFNIFLENSKKLLYQARSHGQARCLCSTYSPA